MTHHGFLKAGLIAAALFTGSAASADAFLEVYTQVPPALRACMDAGDFDERKEALDHLMDLARNLAIRVSPIPRPEQVEAIRMTTQAIEACGDLTYPE